jgi:hypothetical protein
MQAMAFLKHDPSGSSLDHSKAASLPPQLTYQRGGVNQTRGTAATLSSGAKSRESLKRGGGGGGQEYTLQDLEKITSSMKKRSGQGKKTRSSSTKRGTLGALLKGGCAGMSRKDPISPKIRAGS